VLWGSANQVLLKYLRGDAALGVYAASWRIAALGVLLLSQVARVGNPAMANIAQPGVSPARRMRFLLRYSGVMLLVSALVGLPALLVPGAILAAIFRPEYAVETGTLRVMGAYVMVFSVGLVAAQYVIAAHKERTYLASVAAGGVLSIGLCLWLIPHWSGFGAALALLIGHGAAMVLYMLAAIAHLRSPENA